MSALDIFVILLLGGGAIIGFVRGFVHEVLSLGAWIAGVVMLKLFHDQLWTGLTGFVGTSAGAAVLAFALLFIPSFLLVKLLARAIGGRTRKSVLGPVDRVLGGGFGMLKGLIGATLFFLFANLATDLVYGAQADRPEWMEKSRTYPLLNASGRAIVDWVEDRRGTKVEEGVRDDR
jgi:membrane protein required for colicin V production